MNGSYFQKDLDMISASLACVNTETFERWISAVCTALKNGKKIVITGAGKNYPICQKVADTMQSTGLQVYALDACEALHGSMGIICEDDVLIMLSKSGETKELITLLHALRGKANSYIISFTRESTLCGMCDEQIILDLEAEGDLWNLLPNNSTAVSLILLQTLAVQVQSKLQLDLQKDFLANHPGGNIGAAYREKE